LQLYGRAWGCFQDIAQLEHQLNSSGVVMVVQEHRFELFGDDGTRRHFTLAHNAPLGWHELVSLQRERCNVLVRHGPAQPGHTTSPAHAVERLSPGERLPQQSPILSGGHS
jgi:hypothetical protein